MGACASSPRWRLSSSPRHQAPPNRTAAPAGAGGRRGGVRACGVLRRIGEGRRHGLLRGYGPGSRVRALRLPGSARDSRPAGRSVRLAVAIVPPVSQTPAPDPVVFLAGGPGGSAIGAARGLIDAGLNRDRELILMDQRGVAFSKPFLSCRRASASSPAGSGSPTTPPRPGAPFDAVTPPSQARTAARTLPDSTVVDIPGVGHDVMAKSRCAQRVFA